MWKKPEAEEEHTPSPTQPVRERRSTAAVVGASIRVHGEVHGEEDLLIEGTVQGTVRLPNNMVTVGDDGCVDGDVYAHVIHVRGTIVGDLFGKEQVFVHATGNVRGNITAPRVCLEDGAKLKGAIDMDPGTNDRSWSSAMTSSVKESMTTAENAKKSVEALEEIASKKGDAKAATSSSTGAGLSGSA